MKRIPGELNNAFRFGVLRKFGTLLMCAHITGICQASLSQMQRNHRMPTDTELEKLRKFFSDAQLRRFFGKAAVQKISRISNEVGSDART